MTSVLIGGVTLAWAPVAAGRWPTGLLGPPERARAEAFLRLADQQRYVASRVLLRHTVAAFLGVDSAVVGLGQRCAGCGSAEHGRLVLTTDPSVQLSLSRSFDRVVVAVARDVAPIGVDVQAVAATGFDGFDDVALSRTERAAVAALPVARRTAARADYWARKEAVLKARGLGLIVDPSTVFPAESEYELTRVDVGAGYACWLAALPAGTASGQPGRALCASDRRQVAVPTTLRRAKEAG